MKSNNAKSEANNMPKKTARKQARPAEVPPVPVDENGLPLNSTASIAPASIPAPKSFVTTPVATILSNILGVLCDIRKLLGPNRPDFKEEQWYKTEKEEKKKSLQEDLRRLDKSIMEGISQ